MNILSHILQNKIVAIIRGVDPKNVSLIIQALLEGGIKTAEITLNSENAFELISELSEKLGDKVLIGAGTVLDAQSGELAIAHGARFIVSPSLNIELIRLVKQKKIVSIPGAFTATEIVTAYNAGADIVKVFPALSAQYIKDLRGPLFHIPLMPTGGINIHNIHEFRKAGAAAFGIGSSLVDARQQITGDSLGQLKERARQFVMAVNNNPGQQEN